MNLLTYNQSRDLYHQSDGQNTRFPYKEEIYKTELFIIFDAYVDDIKEDPRLNIEKINKYTKILDMLPPILLSIGVKKTSQRFEKIKVDWTKLLRVLDGNHRVIAAKQIKQETISAIIPQSHFRYYKIMFPHRFESIDIYQINDN